MNAALKKARLAQLAAVAAIGCIVAYGDRAKAANENLLEGLPDNLKSLYEGQTDTLQPSAYDSFKMPPAPWKWCHSESYQGNPWRVALTNELRRLVDVYKAAGKISDFELSDSNGDTSRQIAQIRAFIDKKCSIITRWRARRPALMTRSRPPTRRAFPSSRFRARSQARTRPMWIPTTLDGDMTWLRPSRARWAAREMY